MFLPALVRTTAASLLLICFVVSVACSRSVSSPEVGEDEFEQGMSLLRVFEDTQQPETARIEAAEKLGAMRFEPAIPVFLRYIDFPGDSPGKVGPVVEIVSGETELFRNSISIPILSDRFGEKAVVPLVQAFLEEEDPVRRTAFSDALTRGSIAKHAKHAAEHARQRGQNAETQELRDRASQLIWWLRQVDPTIAALNTPP